MALTVCQRAASCISNNVAVAQIEPQRQVCIYVYNHGYDFQDIL